MLACQIGQLQGQIDKMGKHMKVIDHEVKKSEKEETSLIGRMKKVDKEINQLEKDDKYLMKKEHEIEDKEKILVDHDKHNSKEIEKMEHRGLNWGESANHNVIKMTPLPLVPFGGMAHHHQGSPFNLFG